MIMGVALGGAAILIGVILVAIPVTKTTELETTTSEKK